MQDQFYLPQGNFITSENQLKKLRENMLMNHYQNNKPITKDQKNDYNPEQKQIQKYRLDQIQHNQRTNKLMKDHLRNEYNHEIQSKRNKRQFEKKQQLKEEQIRIKQNQLITQQQNQKINLLNKIKRQEFMNDMRMRQELKEKQKKQQQEQKEYFKRKYSQQNVQTSKVRSFNQKYYQRLNMIRDNIQKDYIEHTSPNQQRKEYRKNIIISKGIQVNSSKIKDSLEKQYQIAMREKQNLKESLLKQIEEKRQQKYQSNRKEKQQKYCKQIYKNVHHPIYNPVDFKLTHDNRYILKELQDKGGSKISQLARSASHHLIS